MRTLLAAVPVGGSALAWAACSGGGGHPPPIETPDVPTIYPLEGGPYFYDTGSGSSSGGSHPDASHGDALGDVACVTSCNGVCTDTNNDPQNCGACGNACGMNGTCSGGLCNCSGGVANRCSNKCVDKTQDPDNCGSCGHTCQGGMCMASFCQPTSIAQPGGNIEAIEVDNSTNIYWTLGGSTGGVFMKPIAGGSTQTIQSPDNDPRGIAVNSNFTSVYWADFGTDSIFTRPVMSTGPTGVASTVFGALDGGAATNNPTAVAVDDSNVYWADWTSGNIWQLPLHQATPRRLLATGGRPAAIALDPPPVLYQPYTATSVIWVDFGLTAGTGSINKVPVNGNPASNVVLAGAQNLPWGVAVDSTYVYWTTRSNPGSVQAIVKTAVNGAPAALPVASNQGAPYGVVVDSQFVYWTNYDNNTVSKAPVPGSLDGGTAGSIVQIATGQNNPASMAIDPNNVYWASQGGGQIIKVAK